MVLRHTAEVLTSVSKSKKGCDVTYVENSCVRYTLFNHSYSVVGHDINAYLLNGNFHKNRHKTRLNIAQLIKVL